MRQSCSFHLRTVCVLRWCLSVSECIFCECFFFPFGFEGGMWDLIALVPDHCLSFYFAMKSLFYACNEAKLEKDICALSISLENMPSIIVHYMGQTVSVYQANLL